MGSGDHGAPYLQAHLGIWLPPSRYVQDHSHPTPVPASPQGHMQPHKVIQPTTVSHSHTQPCAELKLQCVTYTRTVTCKHHLTWSHVITTTHKHCLTHSHPQPCTHHSRPQLVIYRTATILVTISHDHGYAQVQPHRRTQHIHSQPSFLTHLHILSPLITTVPHAIMAARHTHSYHHPPQP